MSLLMEWIEVQINNEQIFPTNVGKDQIIQTKHLDLLQHFLDLLDMFSC